MVITRRLHGLPRDLHLDSEFTSPREWGRQGRKTGISSRSKHLFSLYCRNLLHLRGSWHVLARLAVAKELCVDHKSDNFVSNRADRKKATNSIQPGFIPLSGRLSLYSRQHLYSSWWFLVEDSDIHGCCCRNHHGNPARTIISFGVGTQTGHGRT